MKLYKKIIMLVFTVIVIALFKNTVYATETTQKLYQDIKINIDDGKKFKLSGTDLYTIIPITPWEAALGTKAKVNSIDDTKTQIYIPNGIQSGETIEIPQKGYKNPKGERGNLIAQIKIVVPEKLTKEEIDMFKKLKEISKFNPRRV